MKVRIALAVNGNGDFCAGGGGGRDEEQDMQSNLEYLAMCRSSSSIRTYWVEVNVPESPGARVIPAKARPA